MNRKIVMGCIALTYLLTGCSIFAKPVPTVSYDRGEFALAYADIKSAYVLLASNVITACRNKALAAETCQAVERARDRIEALDEQIRDSIRRVDYTVDWKAVGSALRVITDVAIAAGVPGGSVLLKIPAAVGTAVGK